MVSNSMSYCLKEEKRCVRWVERYFDDCLCNLNDDVSFTLGMISLICWAVAEIPQIVTNFRTKSSHGVSLSFLLAWVAGDIFNLVGCLLEPATLPTQYYTALLYTVSTVILVIQTIYYDYFYRLFRHGRTKLSQNEKEDEEKRPLNAPTMRGSAITIPKGSYKASPLREFYYTSARSLAGSGTSPFRSSYFRVAKSGPPAMAIDNSSSSDDEEDTTLVTSSQTITKPRSIPRPAGYATFLAASVSLPAKSLAATYAYRRFLNETTVKHSILGQWLGWLMAAIYMGGRIPQIWLNIKRGTVEGLNPLMFVFALLANATYVGSILVRTTKWDNIKPNLPWLLDAIVCVALDLFIILQYIYYKYCRTATSLKSEEEDSYGNYVEANKAFVS